MQIYLDILFCFFIRFFVANKIEAHYLPEKYGDYLLFLIVVTNSIFVFQLLLNTDILIVFGKSFSTALYFQFCYLFPDYSIGISGFYELPIDLIKWLYLIVDRDTNMIFVDNLIGIAAFFIAYTIEESMTSKKIKEELGINKIL